MGDQISTLFRKVWPYLLVALIIYMPVFGHLGTLPLRIWDEARLASNALEMYNNGNYLVTYINGHEEMWNTKPPFLIWLQVFCFKVLGPSDMAARLPSALAAFATAMYLMYICIRHFQSKLMAITTALVLISTPYYMSMHGARSADYDALLTLCIVVVSFSFYHYTQTRKSKYLYAFFGFLFIGIMTKSVAILMVMPAIALFALLDKQVLGLLKSKHFYIGLFAVVGLVFSYYFAREQVNPGYWEAVKMNELGGRFNNSVEEHAEPFYFYLEFLVEEGLGYWLFFILPAIAVSIFGKNNASRKILLYALLIVVTFLLVISSAGTKIEWYVIPVFPFFALFIGYFIKQLWSFIQARIKPKRSIVIQKYGSVIFISLVFALPLQRIYAKNYLPKDKHYFYEFYEIGRYLKACVEEKQTLKGNVLVLDGYSIHNKFYMRLLQMRGEDIEFKRSKHVEKGDRVILYQDIVRDELSSKYEMKWVTHLGNVETYEIINQKEY